MNNLNQNAFGNTGQSAFDLAVQSGYRGTFDEWQAGLDAGKGPQGEKGDTLDRRADKVRNFIGFYDNLGELPKGRRDDVAVIHEEMWVHTGTQWKRACRKDDESMIDRLLDRVDDSLDIDKEDKEIRDKYANPIVRRVIYFVMLIFFGVFVIYTTSFYSSKPIPEIEFLKHYLDQVVEFLKIFV